ncbi:uncharacterized protein LOC132162029 isoform X2 [Corylus avellana]|uniref:uncharacterized protein LOC132162029 isoform X2 n=1 Tax=Corylus avellana TaxID=13451 RepID=UPI00286BF3CB|nr:uncharacterized protein LOC132162029 isoform X2 [Corylus avellana]
MAMSGRSRSCPTRISLYESSVFDPSPFICHRRLRNTPSHPYYDLVFFKSFFLLGTMEDLTKWYKIKVCAESCAKVVNEIEIHPLWRGQLPLNASYAALGCDLYCFGGERPSSSFVPSSEVYKLVSNFPISNESWIRMPSMKAPRVGARILVLDARTLEAQASPVVEVFDPTTGEWKALPPLPIPLPFESKYTCAALENPNRILLIASLSRTTGALVFCQYYVHQACWKMLNKVHIDCPLGKKPLTAANIQYWLTVDSILGKNAITAGSTLYWLTGDSKLVAYDEVQDVWLLGQLKGQGISFLECDSCDEPHPSQKCSLIHLQGERFAMVQCESCTDVEVQCVIFDVYRQPCNKRFGLGISLVSLHKCKTEIDSFVSDCFVLGK